MCIRDRFILDRQRPAEEPPEASLVPIIKPILDLIGAPLTDASEIGIETALHVVRVQDWFPALFAVTFGEPGEFVPALVVIIDVAVSPRRPDNLRHSVGELPQKK